MAYLLTYLLLIMTLCESGLGVFAATSAIHSYKYLINTVTATVIPSTSRVGSVWQKISHPAIDQLSRLFLDCSRSQLAGCFHFKDACIGMGLRAQLMNLYPQSHTVLRRIGILAVEATVVTTASYTHRSGALSVLQNKVSLHGSESVIFILELSRNLVLILIDSSSVASS